MKRMGIVLLALALAGTSGTAWSSGGSASACGKSDIRFDTRLQGTVAAVNEDAVRMGDAAFAERVAGELGVSANTLVQQRTLFDASWGDLIVAYAIAGSSKSNVTVDQIFGMRSDGRTWTQIAGSLRVPRGRIFTAVRNRTEVFTTESSHGGSACSAAESHARIKASTKAITHARIKAGTKAITHASIKAGTTAITHASTGTSASLAAGTRASMTAAHAARISGPATMASVRGTVGTGVVTSIGR